jgi:uncharacterized protein (TIGR02246 family)
MKIRLLGALVGLAISFSLLTFAQQKETVGPQITEQLDAISKKYEEAVNNNDAAAVAALYTEDGVYVADTGPLYGRLAIEKWYADVFKAWHHSNFIGKKDPHSPRILGTADNIALNGEWSETLQGQSGEPFQLKGYWSAIDTREGDGWKIRMLTYNLTPATTATTTPSSQATLLERLSDPKDWIIGFVVGAVGGLAAVLLLSFRVPRLKISPINKPRPGKEAYTITVINKRKWWWLVTGDAIDIHAELQVVTKYDDRGTEFVNPPITFVRHNPLVIPHRRRFGRLRGLSEFTFDVSREDEKGNIQPDLEGEINKGCALRFRVYARDSFSNYGKIFIRCYQTGQPRWWERWLEPQPLNGVIKCRATSKIQGRFSCKKEDQSKKD